MRIRFFSCQMYIYTTTATSGAGTAYPFGESEFTPGVRATQSLVLCASFRRSLFVIVSFFFWALCCLSFFDYLFGIFKLFMIFVDFKHSIMISSLFDGCKLIRQKKGSVHTWFKFWCLECIEFGAHDAFLE